MLEDVALAHPLKVRAIAEARIKTDKISADLLPRAYAPSKETRDIKHILRQRMFYVRIKTMVKKRIHNILARHPELLFEVSGFSDLFGAAGMKWLSRVTLPGDDNDLLISELQLMSLLKEKIRQSDVVVRSLVKRDARAKLLMSVPGIGPFFSLRFCMKLMMSVSLERGNCVHMQILYQRHMPQVVRCFMAGLPRREASG